MDREQTRNEASARLGEPDDWQRLHGIELLQRLCDGLCAYGVSGDASLIGTLSAMYEVALGRTTPEQRYDMYLAVSRAVAGREISVNALQPFLTIETAAQVVATATIDLAMTAALRDGDPLTWPRRIVALLEGARPASRGGILGGLVGLGDARVNRLLERPRRILDETESADAARCAQGSHVFVAQVDFWLGWAEETEPGARAGSAHFRTCVSALADLARAAAASRGFVEGERNFGWLWMQPGTPSASMRGPFTVDEIGARYAPRLRALALGGAPHDVVAGAVEAFGIGGQP